MTAMTKKLAIFTKIVSEILKNYWTETCASSLMFKPRYVIFFFFFFYMFSMSVNCKSKLSYKLLNVISQLQPETEIVSKKNSSENLLWNIRNDLSYYMLQTVVCLFL